MTYIQGLTQNGDRSFWNPTTIIEQASDVASSHTCMPGACVTMQTDPLAEQRVVVQFGSRTIRGYLAPPAWTTLEDALEAATSRTQETLRIRRVDSDIVEEVYTADAKAIFYVNTFDGDAKHESLQFSTSAPIIHGVWMRFQFKDGEVMEGIVHNSIRYLVDPGFFVIPTDPESNNRLVYIVKNALADHRILGMRRLGRAHTA